NPKGASVRVSIFARFGRERCAELAATASSHDKGCRPSVGSVSAASSAIDITPAHTVGAERHCLTSELGRHLRTTTLGSRCKELVVITGARSRLLDAG